MHVSLKDYEGMAGFGGFGQTSESAVDDLNKALSAGTQRPAVDGGNALRVESLEGTLRVLTFRAEHVKFWKTIPKLPAYSTSEEYNLQTSYGMENGAFTREGELPQTQDASYERKTALIKFIGTQREVTHQATLMKPAHGNLIAQETQNGAMWLMERIERALFDGNSASIPEAFDGIRTQILNDSIAASQNVVDLRGGSLTENAIEEAANIIVEAYGVPTDLQAAPKALSDLVQTMYPRERISLPAPADGTIGMSIRRVMTQAGPLELQGNVFLRSGRNNGARTAPSAATSTRAPAAPTVAGTAVAGPVTGSKFTAADVGTFQYKVTGINRFGETAGVQEAGGVAIAAAADSNSLAITDGAGTEATTGYRIYRSVVGGAAGTEEFVAEIPRTGTVTTWVDLNLYLPGKSSAYMLQMDLQALSFRQLAPMMKIPLATLAASIRWMQLLYGTPILYQPRKAVLFTNVNDR